MRTALLTVLALAACKEVPTQNAYCDNVMYLCNDPTKPVCDLPRNQCVASVADLSGIDMSSDAGGGCTSSAVCANPTPICDGACRACTGPSDDAACASHADSKTKCGSSGSCVECRAGTDCPANKPACDSTGTCQLCSVNADCPNSICITVGANAGQCANATDVAWVDNTVASCGSGNGMSAASAVCQVTSAFGLGRMYIRVNGSSTAYSPVTIPNNTVVYISGPGPKGISPSAKFSGDVSNPAFTVGGTTTNLTLDGIEITGGSAGNDGLYCQNGSVGPSVTVRRSNIHDVVGGAGINASKCKVTLDRNQIGPGNAGGGVLLSGAQYSITNNFIVGNASVTRPGVTLDGTVLASSPGFSHNTVAANGSVGIYGGIQCSGGTQNVANSIVFNNTKVGIGAAATQFTGSCSSTYLATDDPTIPSGTGNVTANPDFVSTTPGSSDYHLTSKTTNNTACCVDRIPSPDPVDHDYDGRARPQPMGGMFDVGAHEVP
jgi:hypothetical protein